MGSECEAGGEIATGARCIVYVTIVLTFLVHSKYVFILYGTGKLVQSTFNTRSRAAGILTYIAVIVTP